MTNPDFSELSMLDLFHMEVETQTALLSENLLALESQSEATSAARSELLASLMRAAHSIKGAARIVQVEPAVKIVHVMEDCFVAAQQGKIILSSSQIDRFLQGVDLLQRIPQVFKTNLEHDLSGLNSEVDAVVASITRILEQEPEDEIDLSTSQHPTEASPTAVEENSSPVNQQALTSQQRDSSTENSSSLTPQYQREEFKKNGTCRGVRVSGENLNRLMGLAGEVLIETNWLLPFADSLQKLRQRQNSVSKDLEKFQELLTDLPADQRLEAQLNRTRQNANECYQILCERLSELELFARRSAGLSDRLYREVIATQMRPFGDGVEGFPRMARDLAKQLGKQVKFTILGKVTPVDRDILEKLEAPLIHILRNAIAHGIESPQERLNLGKPAEGTVKLEATHKAGMLCITVSDDGRGLDLEQLRQAVVSQGMVGDEIAEKLTESELIEFLFLPGFSTAETVTELSGRGVGLDIVRSMVQQVGGNLKAISKPGDGMNFYLQLPLTLSVIRTLLVEISGEVYAFVLSRIEQLLKIPKSAISVVENRQFFTVDNQNIGLVSGHQILDRPQSSLYSKLDVLPVIVISVSESHSLPYGFSLGLEEADFSGTTVRQGHYQASRANCYGVVVDRFLGARDLVVRPLDPRLGKVQDISAAALLEDGSIALIIDVEDLVRSIEKLLAAESLNQVSQAATITPAKSPLRILVVDDSITVREVERKLLENKGYQVEVAVNGMDAWNAIRTNRYDLVVTDVDMPRMNGIELVSQIKHHPNLKSLPVIIVSYKDREEDYIQGLDVGANYYLTKSSFHDDTLLKAVIDLIGEG